MDVCCASFNFNLLHWQWGQDHKCSHTVWVMLYCESSAAWEGSLRTRVLIYRRSWETAPMCLYDAFCRRFFIFRRLRLQQCHNTRWCRMGFSKCAYSLHSLLIIEPVEEGSCWLRPAIGTFVLQCAYILLIAADILGRADMSQTL